MDDSSTNLQLLKSLRELEILQLTHYELHRLLTHLKEVTMYWREQGNSEWGLESLIIRGERKRVDEC